MVSPFAFLAPHIAWIDRAYASVCDDEAAMFSDKGWDKLWARVDMAIAGERSARRGGAAGCVRGGKCPADALYNCDECAIHG